jgi:predicted nucleotidyltransferase
MEAKTENNILHTVAYFNAMRYPLTIFELWRYLIDKKNSEAVDYLQLLKQVDRGKLSEKLKINKGFVTLKGNDELLVEKRLDNQKKSLANIKKIKNWSALFRNTPYIRGVFVTGTLAMKNARAESDWDIMLICKSNRIWIGRLFVGLALQLFGKRRHGEKVTKRFCLNHYLTEDGLILEEHSIYCSFFTSFSFPVVGAGLHKKFLQLNDHWIRKISPNFSKDELTEGDIFNIKQKQAGFQRLLETILERTRLANMINEIAKRMMIKKIKQNPKTYQENADIRYDDHALIFLPNPHRIEVAKEVKRKLTKTL